MHTTSGSSTGDDDIAIEVGGDALQRYKEHVVQADAGAVDVDVTMDGTNWFGPIAIVAMNTTTPATHVLVTTGTMGFRFSGRFKGIRVRQAGVTAVTAVRLTQIQDDD